MRIEKFKHLLLWTMTDAIRDITKPQSDTLAELADNHLCARNKRCVFFLPVLQHLLSTRTKVGLAWLGALSVLGLA